MYDEKGSIATKLVLVLLLIIVLFASYLGFWMVRDPSKIKDIPFAGNVLTPELKDGEGNETQSLQLEINALKETIANKDTDIERYKEDITQLNVKVSSNQEEILKAEIVRLNNMIIDIQSKQKNKGAAYQDLASYYSLMKTKDAAAILSLLNDDDTIGIITHMNNEVAAEILQNLNKEKAATITKKMLAVSP